MLNVVDIYDVAASIGKDFENLIDRYGSDTVSSLMPKIISVLEELEEYASHFSSEEREINTLMSTVERLESEKRDRQREKTLFDEEMQRLEEEWKVETNHLNSLIKRLEQENNNLKVLLKNKSNEVTPCGPSNENGMCEEEIQLMIRLRDLIDRQKVEIRGLRRKIGQKAADLDAVQQQADRLAQVNAELRRKHCIGRKQAEQLNDEMYELQTQITAKDDLVKKMREHVYSPDEMRERQFRQQMLSEEVDFEDSSTGPSTSQMLMQVDPLNVSFAARGRQESVTSGYGGEENTMSLASDVWSEKELIQRLNCEDKMMINSDNGNKMPQFTMDELRAALLERNQLKSRLVEVEEELAVYRRAGDEDPPVQGPINREPDEKNNEPGESGIKRLFARHFGPFIGSLTASECAGVTEHVPLRRQPTVVRREERAHLKYLVGGSFRN